MNLKEIKDAARKAFSDQQSQDTEGGVPDSVSFIAGFQAGAKHIQEILDRADLIQTNREDVLPAAQEAAHYTWLDDKIREVEHHNMNLHIEVDQLVEALKFTIKAAEYLFKPHEKLSNGMFPSNYFTLSYEGDLELIKKTKAARQLLKDLGINE